MRQDQEQDQSQDRDQDRHQGEDRDQREPHVSRRQASYTLHGYNANGHGTGTRTANGESAPFGMAMAYEFDVQDSFTPTFNTATASSFYYSPVSHAGNSSLQLPARRTLEREQQQQQPQQQSRYVAAATSSPSAAATTTTTTTSFAANNDNSVSDADGVVVSSPSPSKALSWLERSASRLTTHKMAPYQFVKDLVTRLADLFEFMDDYSETVAHQS
ncbi:hypothetical protein BGZ99_008690 [Dissophora globulifera]|uniref:Uncharacterized protein n=1 Tax=Dissophora globulifera TaxID=979702 RepID=A0A9P6UP91_9FUNG|nr:hypothetical protein BGZ99_008690 [Dissophora globulifera]